jgi:hypothetical protein
VLPSAVYYANRAFAHTKLENYGAAVEDATEAIRLDPEYIKVRGARCSPLSLTHAPCGPDCLLHPVARGGVNVDGRWTPVGPQGGKPAVDIVESKKPHSGQLVAAEERKMGRVSRAVYGTARMQPAHAGRLCWCYHDRLFPQGGSPEHHRGVLCVMLLPGPPIDHTPRRRSGQTLACVLPRWHADSIHSHTSHTPKAADTVL